MHGIEKVEKLSKLKIDGKFFIDQEGRRVILRGVNLAGISIPYSPNGATHSKSHWPPQDLKNVSWKNRPFPEDKFEEHFIRLRVYGFNCLRILVSWEAIEHAGPYQFDQEFINYIEALVATAGKWGFYVFINFHQDVWSRVNGGDGHPLWLFKKIGMDYTKFTAADCALTMQDHWEAENAYDGDLKYEDLSWNYNARLYPTNTMWTLFWAGRDFAPLLKIKDEKSGDIVNVQDYMQNHYFAAMSILADKLKNQENVIGFNPINEPSKGYISKRIGERPGLESFKSSDGTFGEPGIAWSPLDGMAVAYGFKREIDELGISLLKGLKVIGKRTLNCNETSIWLPDAEPVWLTHNVWAIENNIPVVDNEDYFRVVQGNEVDFTQDYLIPFHVKVSNMINEINPDWMIILENDPALNGSVTIHPWPDSLPNNAVNGFHWYDLAQLGLKKWLHPISFDLLKKRPVFGRRGIQRMYERQLVAHVENSQNVNDGNFPIILGEFGISMDMDDKKAYKKWSKGGNKQNWRTRKNKAFNKHEQILNLMYNVLDKHFLSSTQWNYAAFNNNQYGDQWNLEDLSIYSKDQEVESFTENKYSGARGLAGFCRTYALRIPGKPLNMKFNWKNGEFILEYLPDPEIKEPGVIFAPYVQYPHGYHMKCVGGARTIRNLAEERVYLYNTSPEQVFFIMFRHDAFWI